MSDERPQRFRVAFVGGGLNSAVGRAHFSACRMDGHFEVVAGCFSRRAEVNRETAAAYGVAPERTYASSEQLLERESREIDALVVLTPTSDHVRPVVDALGRGVPVICEKALATTVEGASTIRVAQGRSKGFLAVTYNYSGYPAVRELRDLVERGVLGRLRHFAAEMPQEGFVRCDSAGRPFRPQDWRLYDGPIPTLHLDLGVHLHQLTHYLTGRQPERVGAWQRAYGNFADVIDFVEATVEYDDDVIGRFTFGKSMLGHRNGLSLSLYGDEASVSWVQSRPEELRICDRRGRIELLDRAGDVRVAHHARYTRFKAGHPAGYVEAFANLYADIHGALAAHRRGESIESREVFGADLSLTGLKFLGAMADSARQGRRVDVPGS